MFGMYGRSGRRYGGIDVIKLYYLYVWNVQNKNQLTHINIHTQLRRIRRHGLLRKFAPKGGLAGVSSPPGPVALCFSCLWI